MSSECGICFLNSAFLSINVGLELKEYWTLSSQELDFTKSKSRKSRLAFAFLLKYFQANMHFPINEEQISLSVIKISENFLSLLNFFCNTTLIRNQKS